MTLLNHTTLPEADPHNYHQHQAGAKLDAGKQLPFLVLSEFSQALARVVKVGTFGAIKYTPRGWVQVPNGIERYTEAAARHMMEQWQGIRIDTDSGCDHEAQVIWNLLAAYELKLRKELASTKTIKPTL